MALLYLQAKNESQDNRYRVQSCKIYKERSKARSLQTSQCRLLPYSFWNWCCWQRSVHHDQWSSFRQNAQSRCLPTQRLIEGMGSRVLAGPVDSQVEALTGIGVVKALMTRRLEATNHLAVALVAVGPRHCNCQERCRIIDCEGGFNRLFKRTRDAAGLCPRRFFLRILHTVTDVLTDLD